MKKALMKLLPHLIVFVVLFFVVPLVLELFFSSEKMKGVLLLLLFFVNPALCVILGTLYGSGNGFKPYYPLIPPLFFMLSAWLVYNSSAYIYALIYLAVSLAGLSAGSIYNYISKRNKRKRDNGNITPHKPE